MFSGGTDSTLAAARMLERFERVTLLTLDPGYLFFLANTRVHADALIEHYGARRVEHRVLQMREVAGRILWGEIGRDLRRYGFNMTALVCLGCRLSMHAAALLHNLQRGIPFIADGSIAAQDAIPEQMASTLARNRRYYLETFGVWHEAPIYDETASDRVLEQLGLARQTGLKRQFVLFDTQYTCPFGVPADVYARLFYKPLMDRQRERQSAEYQARKHPQLRELVDRRLAEGGESLEEIAGRMRAFHRAAGRGVTAGATP